LELSRRPRTRTEKVRTERSKFLFQCRERKISSSETKEKRVDVLHTHQIAAPILPIWQEKQGKEE